MATPPFPLGGCYLSGAPCQMIIRQLSDACQMFHQTSVRQVIHIHQTCTIRPPYIYCTICTSDMFQWSSNLNYQMLVRCSTRHLLTPTRHLSDKYHIYNRNVPYAHHIHVYTVPYVHQICFNIVQD